MELREFIGNTLTQIAEGVQNAIDASGGADYLVNPSTQVSASYTIHFDICVEAGHEGKANISVLGGSVSERAVNRISFDVVMSYPHSGDTKRRSRPDY